MKVKHPPPVALFRKPHHLRYHVRVQQVNRVRVEERLKVCKVYDKEDEDEEEI